MKRKIDFKFHVIQMADQRVTVGYVPIDTPDGLHVSIAAAWTNPKDQFVKARGREIVAGRLAAKRKNLMSITIPNVKHPTKAGEYRELENQVVQKVLDNMPKAVVGYVERQERKMNRLLDSIDL